MNGPILIASDGGGSSKGALRVGLSLARASQRDAEVVVVLQPFFPRYGISGLAPFPEGYALYESVEADALRQAVTRQLESIGEEAAHLPVSVELGSPAPAIVRRARAIGAGLIVVGAGQHAPLDRWLGDETALKVGRLSSVPVLAVPTTATDLPTRALVAMDFSEYGLRAAHAVLEVLGEHAHVFLVHLMWPPTELEPFPSLGEWRRTYQQGAEARLEEIAAALRAKRPLDVECMVASGDPAEELLGLADRLNADVIAAGSHGYGFVGRAVMGSVSTRLVRGARCAVLVAPPSAPAELQPEPRSEAVSPPGPAPLIRGGPME